MLRHALGAPRLVVPLCALLLSTSSLVWAEAYDESLTIDGRSLHLANLVGEVTVETHSGSSFEIVARVSGDDAAPGRIEFDTSPGILEIVFPLQEEKAYVYPELSRRNRTRFHWDPFSGKQSDSLVGKIFRRGRGPRVRVSGSGSGLELWVDVVVRAPKGAEVTIESGVGHVRIQGETGPLTIKTHTGRVSVDGGEGETLADTGNGDVFVTNRKGKLVVDTGNGDVELRTVEGDEIRADTGNGDVDMENVICRRLVIDTGNGRVDALQIKADDARLDTGNGSVDAEFLELSNGRYIIDTGNGSITLRLPADASAEVRADSGGGRVRLDVDERNVEVIRHRRDNAHLRMGDGDAHIRLDSGHGSISIEA